MLDPGSNSVPESLLLLIAVITENLAKHSKPDAHNIEARQSRPSPYNTFDRRPEYRAMVVCTAHIKTHEMKTTSQIIIQDDDFRSTVAPYVVVACALLLCWYAFFSLFILFVVVFRFFFLLFFLLCFVRFAIASPFLVCYQYVSYQTKAYYSSVPGPKPTTTTHTILAWPRAKKKLTFLAHAYTCLYFSRCFSEKYT